MVTWVLERDVFADADVALASAVSAAGGRVVWWSDEWWVNGRWPRLDGPVVFHGSLGNADRVARELSWSPGAWCATDRFACSAWWPEARERLVSSEFVFTTVGALVGEGPPVEFGDRVFVRPDSPLKPFSGRVLRRGEVTLRGLDHGFYYDDVSVPVVVSLAVTVGAEWRFVVVAGSVVAGSGYAAVGRVAGSPVGHDHPAWRYAASLAAVVPSPDLVFVLDVCETDAGLRLLELNSFSGSDLCGCDRAAIVGAVHALLG